MNTYILHLKHNGGVFVLQIHARNKEAAKAIVMKAEGCPEEAIIKIEKGGR